MKRKLIKALVVLILLGAGGIGYQFYPVSYTHLSLNAHFLLIALHITKRCLRRNGTDRSCTVHMIIPEHLFCIGVGIGLIITGEVQIDIGNLIPFKACLLYTSRCV